MRACGWRSGLSRGVMLAICLGILMAGCSAPEGRGAIMRRASVSVAQAIAGGPVTVRLNPSNCDCPPFETWVQGVWIRLQLLPNTVEDNPELLFSAQPNSPLMLTLTLEGSKPQFCANGTAYFQARVVNAP